MKLTIEQKQEFNQFYIFGENEDKKSFLFSVNCDNENARDIEEMVFMFNAREEKHEDDKIKIRENIRDTYEEKFNSVESIVVDMVNKLRYKGFEVDY